MHQVYCLCRAFSGTGTSIQMFEYLNGTVSNLVPVADKSNNRFLLVSTEGNNSTGFGLYAFIYNSLGEKLRDSIKLASQSTVRSQARVSGACYGGTYLLAWDGDNTSTGPKDVYAGVFGSDLEELSEPVQLNPITKTAFAPKVTCDAQGRFLVAWTDSRAGGNAEIYGQLLDVSAQRIGTEKLLTTRGSSTGIFALNAFRCSGAIFNMAWQEGFTNGNPTIYRVSRWQIDTALHGVFTSSLFDAGSRPG